MSEEVRSVVVRMWVGPSPQSVGTGRDDMGFCVQTLNEEGEPWGPLSWYPMDSTVRVLWSNLSDYRR